jgi:hypothetical protein
MHPVAAAGLAPDKPISGRVVSDSRNMECLAGNVPEPMPSN